MSYLGIFKFLFEKFRDNDNNDILSTRMYESLIRRINERRNKDLVSLLMFLQNGQFPKSTQELSYSSKPVIFNLASNIYNRLFPTKITNINTEESTSTKSNAEAESQAITPNLIDEMNEFISSIVNVKKSNSNTNQNIVKQLKLYENCQQKTADIDLLFNALITIPPTSTESERVFSISNNFCTKVRNSLKYETLDTLVFLKYHFLNVY